MKVPTWAGFDAGCPIGELGLGVIDHLVGFGVVECKRRTIVFTGSIIIKIPAGLEKRKDSDTDLSVFIMLGEFIFKE